MRATAEPLEGNLVRLSVEIDEPEFDRALGDVVRDARPPGARAGLPARQGAAQGARGADGWCRRPARRGAPRVAARLLRPRRRRHRARSDRAARDRHHRAARTAVPSPSTPWSRCARSSPSPATTGCRSPCPASRVDRRGGQTPARPAARERRGARGGGAPRHRRRPGDHRPARQRRHRAPRWSASTTTSTRWQRHGRPRARRRAARRQGRRHRRLRRAEPRTTPEQTIAFRVLVKEVKVKKLPEATDEWAAESSEFATVAELRADIADRIGRVKLMQSQMALRQKTIEAARRAGRRRRRSPRSWSTPRSTSGSTTCSTGLEAQKLGLAEYFQATGTHARRAAGRGPGGRPGGGQGRPGASGPGRGRGVDAQ